LIFINILFVCFVEPFSSLFKLNLSFLFIHIVPTCQLPVSNRGQSKSYISINPQLSSVISSLSNIITSLNSASTEWWKHLSKDCHDTIIHNLSAGDVDVDVDGASGFEIHEDDIQDDEVHCSAIASGSGIVIEDESFVGKKRRNINYILKNYDEDTDNDDYNDDHDRMNNEDNHHTCKHNHTKTKKIRLNDTVEHIPFQSSNLDTTQEDNDNVEHDDLTQPFHDEENDDNNDDDDETQQYSIDDSTQPFSDLIEKKQEQQEYKRNRDGTNDHEQQEKEEEEDDEYKQSQELIEFNNDNYSNTKKSEETFVNSPPVAMIKNTNTNTPKNDNDITTTLLNKSCIIPKNHSPKFSPIAFIGSQNSIPSIMKHKRKEVISFMDIFQLLLNRLDNGSSNEELFKCNNGLLDGYCIHVGNDFDGYDHDGCSAKLVINENICEENSFKSYTIDMKSFTKGRICLILKLCGAEVKDLNEIESMLDDEVAAGLISTRVPIDGTTLILVQGHTSSLSNKRGLLREKEGHTSIPLVNSQWVFDSIRDFEVKQIQNYYVG
jgi:hypothetical protein